MSIDRAKAQKAAQKYLAKGQIDRAIAEYEKVVASDPGDARSLLKLGDLYTKQGDSRGAVGAYRKVAAQYSAQGFFLKAVAVCKQILKLDPSDLPAIESLADMYEKLSLTSDALAAYEQVADAHTRSGKPEKALAALGHLANLDKENVAVWIRYAEALSKADRIDEATNAFRMGADLLKRQGRLEDFIKVTERLLFHSHEDIDRARDLAALYISRGQAKAALAHLQTCFKVDPRDVGTLELLAKAFAGLDQGHKAVSVYRELARVHGEAGRAQQEGDALRALLELEPDDADARRRLQTVEVATAPDDSVELLEDDDDAVVIVDDEDTKAAHSAPMNLDLEREAQIARLMAECEVFLRYGLRDKVIAQLGRVIELDPSHVDAREKLKDELLKRGDKATAVEHLLALSGYAHDSARARGYLEQAAQLDPNRAEIAERLRQLAAPAPLMEAGDDDDVIIVGDEPDAPPEEDFSALRSQRPSSRRTYDETDFSDLRSSRPPTPEPSEPRAFGGFRTEGPTAEIEIVALESSPPPEPEPVPALGPREVSLATALEGPSDDEPELVLEDSDEPVDFDDEQDEEPGLYTSAGDSEPALYASAGDSEPAPSFSEPAPELSMELEPEPEHEAPLYSDPAPEPEPEPEPEPAPAFASTPAERESDAPLLMAGEDEEEELPEEVAEAIEEADFYLAQKLFDEAREVLIEAMYEYPSDTALRAKLAEIDAAESGGAAATQPEPEDQSFAFAQKLAGEVAPPAQGPVAVDQVIAQFKAGVQRQVDRSDTATHYDLGIAYMEMGLHNEAIDEFKLCLENPSKRCTAHTMIGLSFVAKADWQSALEHFMQALQSPGRTPEEDLTLWFEVGNAYELLGKASEALVYYEKVEEVNPSFRDVSARIERLGVFKSEQQETDEFDAMFDNMIVKE